jgi:hypothetical protein
MCFQHTCSGLAPPIPMWHLPFRRFTNFLVVIDTGPQIDPLHYLLLQTQFLSPPLRNVPLCVLSHVTRAECPFAMLRNILNLPPYLVAYLFQFSTLPGIQLLRGPAMISISWYYALWSLGTLDKVGQINY